MPQEKTPEERALAILLQGRTGGVNPLESLSSPKPSPEDLAVEMLLSGMARERQGTGLPESGDVLGTINEFGPGAVGALGLGSMALSGGMSTPAVVALAMLGGGLGKAGQLGMNAAFGEEIDPLQAQQRVGQEMAFQGAGETAGVGVQAGLTRGLGALQGRIGPLLSKIPVPFQGAVTPEAKEASKFLGQVFGEESKFGVPLPQLTKSRILDLMNNFIEGSLGGGQITSVIESTGQALKSQARANAKYIAEILPADELGLALGEILDGTFKAGKFTSESLRKQVVSAAASRGSASNVPIGRIRDIVGEALPASSPIHKALAGPDLPIETALELSDSLVTFGEGLPKGVDKALIDRIQKTLRGSIDSTLAEIDPKLVAKLRLAEMGGDEAPYLQAIISKAKDNPTKLVEGLMGDLKAPERIEQLGAVLRGAKEWEQFRAYTYDWLLSQATDKTTGDLLGSELKILLEGIDGSGFKGISEKALRNVFEPGELQFLKNLANSLNVLQARQATGTGKVASQLLGARAIQLTIASGAAVAGGTGSVDPSTAIGALGLVFIGPRELGKIMVSPKMRRLLLRGIELPADSVMGRQIAARLTAYLAAFGVEEQKSDTAFDPQGINPLALSPQSP